MDIQIYLDMAKSFLEYLEEQNLDHLYEDEEGLFSFDPQVELNGREVFIDSGASKIVIVPSDLPYVIKIPFRGRVNLVNNNCYGCREDICYDCPHIGCEEQEFDDFRQAKRLLVINKLESDDLCAWDYCYTEAKIYEEAKKNKVEELFIETKKIGECNNHPVYIQKKALPRLPYNLQCTEKSKEFISQRFSGKKLVQTYNPDFLYLMVDKYGEEKTERMLNFTEGYQIGDLHDSNIGLLDNNPVIFDYSGFYY